MFGKSLLVPVVMLGAVTGAALTGCGSNSQHAATVVQTTPTASVIAQRMHLPDVVVYTAATDPNHLLGRQGGYTSNVDAGPTRTAGDTGSIGIEVYPTQNGAAQRVAYLKNFSGTVFGDGYDYTAGSAILRLDPTYTPAQAKTLEVQFQKSVQHD